MATRISAGATLLFAGVLSAPALTAPLDGGKPGDAGASPPAAQLWEKVKLDDARSSDPQPISSAALSPSSEASSWKFDERFQHPAVSAAIEQIQSGKVHQALQQLRAAAMEDPSMPPELLMMAYILLRNQRWNEGAVALEKAAVLHKDHPEVYQACGQFALMQDRNTDAWSHFQLALRVPIPEEWNDEQKKEFLLRCFVGLAAVSENRRDWQEAAHAFEQWSELEQLDAVTHYRWAKALLHAQAVEKAFKRLKEAHRLEPALNPPELMIAALYTEMGQFEKAAAWYETAVEKYPGDSRVHYEYAGSLLLAGHTSQSREQLQKAAEGQTNFDSLQTDLLLMRGLVARSEKEFEEAESLFTRVLRNSPGNPLALSQLPLVLIEQNDEAKKTLARQIAIANAQKNPRSMQALKSLGWVQYRLGNLNEAEKALKAGASATTKDGELLFFLAQVLLEQGKTAQSQRVAAMLRTAVEEPGLFILRREARQWLDAVSLVLQAAP